MPGNIELSSLEVSLVNVMRRDIPGCYVKIGTGVGHPIHHPAFCVDESVILPAAKYLVEVLRVGLGE